jgi:hypothetical protein
MTQAADAEIPLDRDVFMRTLVRELATSLESVVGLEEASGYLSVVGQTVGAHIDDLYTRALGVGRLSREQVAGVLVDLKQRIQGDFYVIEQNDQKIVLGNRRCPFAEKVLGRESMCMLTSNVFGTIAARSLGYARIELLETIARGNAGCRIVVDLVPGEPMGESKGREYFGDTPPLAATPAEGTVVG